VPARTGTNLRTRQADIARTYNVDAWDWLWTAWVLLWTVSRGQEREKPTPRLYRRRDASEPVSPWAGFAQGFTPPRDQNAPESLTECKVARNSGVGRRANSAALELAGQPGQCGRWAGRQRRFPVACIGAQDRAPPSCCWGYWSARRR
jgi:hypothetical protein